MNKSKTLTLITFFYLFVVAFLITRNNVYELYLLKGVEMTQTFFFIMQTITLKAGDFSLQGLMGRE